MANRKRRLHDGEREVLSLGTMTLTDQRVILWCPRPRSTTSLLLGHVSSTSVHRWPCWITLVVRAGRAAVVIRRPVHDGQRVVAMADAIDRAAAGRT